MSQPRTPGGQRPSRRPDPLRRGGRGSGRAGTRGASGRIPAPTRVGGGYRSTSRPAAARRAAATGAAKRTRAPEPHRFGGRLAVLGGVLVALALAYTYPLRDYLSQQSEIARIEADQAKQRRHIEELAQEAELWKDPEYIMIQARERFYMAKPGEKPLIVLFDPEGAARDAGVDPDAGKTPSPDPWYDTLWSSIEAANQRGAS